MLSKDEKIEFRKTGKKIQDAVKDDDLTSHGENRQYNNIREYENT